VRPAWLSIVAVPFLCGFSCGHPQAEGPYVWTVADGGIKDPCHLVTDPAQVATGTLLVIGDTVRMDDFAFQGVQMKMVGTFESGIEVFTMDGSAANVSATVNGQSCSIDLDSVHFDATTDDPTHFHGAMKVTYDVPSFPACQCEAELTYTAAP
jgi:hypothetical protein